MTWNPKEAWKRAGEMSQAQKNGPRNASPSVADIDDETAKKKKDAVIGCGCLTIIVALIGMVVIGHFLPDDPGGDLAPTASASASTAPETTSTPSANAKRDALKLLNDVAKARFPCDLQAASVDLNMKRQSAVDVYSSAGRAAEYCSGTASTIGGMKVPDVLDEQTFSTALDDCRAADEARAGVFRALQTVVDDEKISNQAAMRDAGDEAVAKAQTCASGLVSAAASVGVTEKEAHDALNVLK